MNFDKIDIIRYNNKCLKVWTTDNQKMDKINFDLENMVCPFGIEKFIKTSYINWEVDNDLENILTITDLSFKNELIRRNSEYCNWKWISAIRSKEKFKTLLRTRYDNHDCEKMLTYKKSLYYINITIDSIWLNTKTKTFGILWITNIIYSTTEY